MSGVQELKEKVRALSGLELRELRAWLDEYEDEIWSRKFEGEVASGKWDELGEASLRDHAEGKSTPL